MNKKAIDDKLKEWLEEEVKKENQIIEDSVFSDGEEEQKEITEEELDMFYDAFMEKVQIREKEEKEKKEKVRYSKSLKIRHRLVRAAGFVIVCTLAVFAASMTSEANRNYFVNSVKYLTGNDTKILVDNDEESDKPSYEEDRVREEIKEKIGVDVPQFLYRPESFEFYDYVINEEAKIGNLQYIYNENVISMYISKDLMNIQSNSFSLSGNSREIIYMSKEEIPARIVQIQEKKDSIPTYLAEWVWKGQYYQVSGKMPKDIFKKLIKEIIF